jgi:hypothetical protein
MPDPILTGHFYGEVRAVPYDGGNLLHLAALSYFRMHELKRLQQKFAN